MHKKLEKILECIEDINFILNHNEFVITQTIEDKILKPAIKMNIVRIAEQFENFNNDYEIDILKNFKNEDLKSMNDIYSNYDLDDTIVENIVKNHLPTIKATIVKMKEEIQKSKTRLSEKNKAKLKELEIFKNNFRIHILNGWTDLVYELGKNIEELCKLANCELPKIEYIQSKYASLRFDYYFETPVPKIVEKLIDSLIYQAEDKSERICEFCGADGEIRIKKSTNWYIAICDKCANERNDLVKIKEFGN